MTKDKTFVRLSRPWFRNWHPSSCCSMRVVEMVKKFAFGLLALCLATGCSPHVPTLDEEIAGGMPKTIDNVSCRLGDDIAGFLTADAVVSVAADGFSLSAFEHLADELESVKSVRFVFTAPAFVPQDGQALRTVDQEGERQIHVRGRVWADSGHIHRRDDRRERRLSAVQRLHGRHAGL